MSRNLCDETFPASLLIEFDELDDEIPISPDLPKHHSLGAFPRHHSTLSGGPTIENASGKGHDDRNGMVISGSSNTSSGHSSLSTEGENRSASSERDTGAVPHRNEGAVLGDKLC
ncbi:AGAP011795-PA-like protein [Anopheles sinensis]|uniref:AGAP011795-PA-like protein n=1 Tax=Anopheles sinensis TaxID=74873 RepID=A0A084WHQ8_ANOSI|nr:AGAP011795-PA-like protein [Anopheles sinensis]